MTLKSGETIGEFTIEKQLAMGKNAGGMSQVFLAYSTATPTYKVVVKVSESHDNRSSAYQNLLKREASILKKLHHPHVVRIFPIRTRREPAYFAKLMNHANQPWYYLMEYIPSKSLEDYIKQIRQYPMKWRIELFYQILTTVHYLHGKGFAHGDLKPQNILFRTPPDPAQFPSPVLIDFGSASNVVAVDNLTASIRYSPPEILNALARQHIPDTGIRADKVDIWSLGVLLYEIVTGQPLFNQRSKKQITTTIMRGKLRKMSDFLPERHDSLDKYLEVMLRMEGRNRPNTTQLLKAIEERISSVSTPRIAY